MTETLAYGYSSERTQFALSNEYQYDSVWMVFKNLCILVLWKIVASALEGFIIPSLTELILRGPHNTATEYLRPLPYLREFWYENDSSTAVRLI